MKVSKFVNSTTTKQSVKLTKAETPKQVKAKQKDNFKGMF